MAGELWFVGVLAGVVVWNMLILTLCVLILANNQIMSTIVTEQWSANCPLKPNPDQPDRKSRKPLLTGVLNYDENNIEKITLLIQLNQTLFVRISLYDAFTDQQYDHTNPFRLNVWYGESISDPKPDLIVNNDNPVNAKMKTGTGTLVYSYGEEIPKTQINDTDGYSWMFEIDHKPYHVCSWPPDPLYWQLASNISRGRDRCNKIVKFPYMPLLIIYYKGYFYWFDNSRAFAVPERIISDYDPVYGRHLVRFTSLLYKRMFICQRLAWYREVVRFHRKHVYFYFIDVVIILVAIYLVWYVCKRSRQTFSDVSDSDLPEDESNMVQVDEDNQIVEQDTSQVTANVVHPIQNVAIIRDPMDDTVPRTLPVLMQRPSFQLTMQTNLVNKQKKTITKYQ